MSPIEKPVRKPSYIVLKEEKESLTKEVQELQIELEQLLESQRHQKYDVSEAAASLSSLLRKQLETLLLRDALQKQRLAFANAQSSVSSYLSGQETIPHEITIRLGRCPKQRRETLLDAKRKKINASLAYLNERTRFLDPFRPFSEKSRYMLDGGDFCVHQIDQMSIDSSLVTVRQMFDAIAAYFANMEMRVTDLLGDITTRDEIGYGVDGIQQSRYESFLSCGVPLEVNTVTFQEFTERSDECGGGGPFGVFTSDFVDVDECFPYRPHQCVRHDITAALTIRTHKTKQFNPVTGREDDKSVVVWTHSYFGRLRNNGIQLPPMVEQNLHQQLGRWGDIMMLCVLEQIYGHQQVSSRE